MILKKMIGNFSDIWMNSGGFGKFEDGFSSYCTNISIDFMLKKMLINFENSIKSSLTVECKNLKKIYW